MSMFQRFLPRETSFFDFFEKHAELTVQGAQEFLQLVSEGGNISARASRIKEIEHETDVITHQCVDALHRTFITPIERDDIHRLISRMDDIMDYIEAASERMSLYEIKEMQPETKAIASVLVRATQQVREAVKGLRNLKNVENVIKTCIDVNRLENEGDVLLRNAVARLFREETNAITIVKWKEIFENLESATDRCEDVANIIEGVILEHA
jgi:predicted phosphate transport protein (TIGR00153 family)